MVLPLPGALSQFSVQTLKNIEALSAIQQSVPNIQGQVKSNIASAVTGSITKPGDLLENVPDFASEHSQTFLDNVSAPKSLAISSQQKAFGDVFGTSAISGAGIDSFISQNVKLDDILPAQQLFNTVKTLSAHALYTDPLQAYSHIHAASEDVTNLCQEATAIIAVILQDTADLVSLQPTLTYDDLEGMTNQFFKDASSQTKTAIGLFELVSSTFVISGKYNPTQVSALCTALNIISGLMTVGGTKFIQFDRLRKKVDAGVKRLREIGRELKDVTQNVKGFIPTYVTSAVSGKLFNAVQAKVLQQAGIDLKKVLRDLDALSSLSADDRAKLLANWAIAGSLQAIRAYICKLQPSTEVVSVTDPVIAPIKAEYDSFVSIIDANPIASAFDTLETQADSISSVMQSNVTRDAGTDLISEIASLSAILTPLAAAIALIETASAGFKTVFATITSPISGRVTGATDLFEDTGMDNMRSVALTKSFDSFNDLNINESTTLGQLTRSMEKTITELPESNERDQMILAYQKVLGRHRAKVVGMAFQQREDIATFVSLSEEETDRELINKVNKQSSGIPSSDFDSVTT